MTIFPEIKVAFSPKPPHVLIGHLLLVESCEIEQPQETMDTFSLVTISREISDTNAAHIKTYRKDYDSCIQAFAK